MKRACIEFYRSEAIDVTSLCFDDVPTHSAVFSWRLRAKNGQIILSPHETFVSHRNAVASFARICKALDAQGVWEVKDLEGIKGDSIRMLEGAQGNKASA